MLTRNHRAAAGSLAAALCLAVLFGAATPTGGPVVDLSPELGSRWPRRSGRASSGSQFVRRLRSLEGAQRDAVVLAELLRGNLPDFLRELKPVRLWGADRGGRIHKGVVWVTPDYLSIGRNEDFVRVPMGFDAAAALARSFGFSLPTKKIVDAIHEQSTLRLRPQPMPAGPRMRSTDFFVRHHLAIERERAGRTPGELTSGHKKDLILTKELLQKRRKLAIYGWHQGDGHPIQPVSTFHGRRYSDYSHGVRLVSATMLLDSEIRSIFDVLHDPDLALVLSDEGPMDAARILRR